MAVKDYYEKYWKQGKSAVEISEGFKGHAQSIPGWPQKELDVFLGSVSKYVGASVLDIGAGNGVFLNYIKSKLPPKTSLKGLEISSAAIELAKEDVEIFQGSAEEKFPFEDNSFDTLFMTDVLEHLVDIDTCLSECTRVLKEGGRLIVLTPDYNLLKKVLISAFFWEKYFYPNNPHVRFFTKKSLTDFMKRHGFEVVFYKWGLTWWGIMPQNSYYVFEKRK